MVLKSFLDFFTLSAAFMLENINYCVIRPEQRSNKRLKGQDGKPLPRLKRGFGPLSALGPSGSLHDMYIRAGVSLRLESIKSPSTAYRPPHKDRLPHAVGTDSTQDISLSVVIPTVCFSRDLNSAHTVSTGITRRKL